MLELNQQSSSKIIQVIQSFLESQLGERPQSVSCYLNNNVLAIYAAGVISPAEKQLMNSKADHKILIEFKTQQFESVKEELCAQLNQLTDNQITHIHTTITDAGMRIINIQMD